MRERLPAGSNVDDGIRLLGDPTAFEPGMVWYTAWDAVRRDFSVGFLFTDRNVPVQGRSGDRAVVGLPARDRRLGRYRSGATTDTAS